VEIIFQREGDYYIPDPPVSRPF